MQGADIFPIQATSEFEPVIHIKSYETGTVIHCKSYETGTKEENLSSAWDI